MKNLKFRYWCALDEKYFYNYEDDFCYWLDGEGEIQQYTGLKDKNGVEIYEGDILKHNPDDDDWNDYVVWWGEKGRFELASFVNYPIQKLAEEYRKEDLEHPLRIYSDPLARAEANRNCTMLKLADLVQDSSNPSKIIGNIYENQELLKVGD